MIQVVFKNLKESEFVKEAAIEKMKSMIERFPDLSDHKITSTLSMENSPLKPGPDLFTVKIVISGWRYKDLVLKKSGPNIYAAMAEVFDYALERLNRYGDKNRVKELKKQRDLQKTLLQSPERKSEDHDCA